MNDSIDFKFPKVTIMIPTYNQEEYIGEAIESALAQDYPNIEIIVADDCSTDATSSVIKKYCKDPRIRAIRSDKNMGRVGNYRKTAEESATGEWLINLDGDDYFTSNNFISNAIEEILKCKESNIVAYCYAHPVDQLRRWLPNTGISDDSILIKGSEYFIKYYSIGSFGHANILYKREAGLRIGMYVLPYQASDFHSLMRIFLEGDIILDKRKVSHWRRHGKNTTYLEVDEKWEEAQLTLLDLQKYASKFFSEEELSFWRKKMDHSFYIDYLQTRIRCRKDFKSFWILITHPQLNRQYVKDWYDFIFH